MDKPKKDSTQKPGSYESNNQGGTTCDERSDKPGLRGHGAARTLPMKYKDE